jgi:16S rRNA (guanine966-N2)-methyltransferase
LLKVCNSGLISFEEGLVIEMRVIAGTAKGLRLKSADGLNTRPTTDRNKETLFNMSSPDIYGCVFLDLFSGSGAIGIEALSRGAKRAVFIENNYKALKCLEDNLVHTGLNFKAEVMAKDVIVGLKSLDKRKVESPEEHLIFDYIFVDPPYKSGLEKKVLEVLSKSSIINSESTIILEADIHTCFEYLEEIGFRLFREKRYKSNKHIFISRET